jgi:excisionase family DNA binding protein
MDDRLLTLKQVAEYLGVSTITVRRLAKSGELPGFKVGKDWRFQRKDILSYVEKQKGQST